MRRYVAWGMIAAIALTGCGQVRNPVGTASQAAALRARAAETSPAKAFYARMKDQYQGAVTIAGDQVTLRSPDQPASVYDFAQTSRTGTVQVTIGEFQVTLPLADLMAEDAEGGPEVLPALLVPIALDMAAAGTQALALYWLGHRGDAFDKGDAAKAVALAMALAIVPFLGEMSALGKIVPVAAKLVASSGGFGAREIARAAAAMSGEILELVKYLYRLHKTKGSAEAP